MGDFGVELSNKIKSSGNGKEMDNRRYEKTIEGEW